MKLLLLALTFAIVGCTPHATMSTPAGFGRVDGHYDFRAVSPSGIVIAARIKPNRPHSDLNFWTSAVDLSLIRKGYTRTEVTDVKSATGLPGRLLKYDAGAGSSYWIAVFSRGETILLAEATGYTDDVRASAEELQRSLLSARLD
jgi:hypothetical protein